MAKKIGIAFAVLLAVLLVVIAMQPATYHVERSKEIAAPADVVFGLVGDLAKFPQWSPWQHLDPGMKVTTSGDTAAVGGTYSWAGNKDVGSGKMTLTELSPPTHAAVKLEFVEPFASVANTTWTVEPAGPGAKATWAMDGDNDFMGKAMSLVMNMDSMIGGDFESGLANLEKVAVAAAAKAKAEAEAAAKAKAEAEAEAKAKAEAEAKSAAEAVLDGSSVAAEAARAAEAVQGAGEAPPAE